MSRTIKRVPREFNWPLGKLWRGYSMPEGKEVEPPEGGLATMGNGQ